MQFVFNGSLEELKETIYSTAQKLDRSICIRDDEPDMLKIGFSSLHHGGGRFFVAKVKETDTQVFLDGEIIYLYSGERLSKTASFLLWPGCLFDLYILMEILLLFLWFLIFQFSHIWIPIILPIIFLAFFEIFRICEIRKRDSEFVKFMSTFTSRY